jgi:ABC-type dipeptide/oligopeptide/nickel transport system ATPase component
MRQRALIAMAIACQPKLIIADEPTTALDFRTQQEVLDCLLRLKREMGMSLLFISHDLGLVAKFADRLAIMHQGKIVEVGETAEVLARPEHPQTLRLLEAAERFNNVFEY